MELHLESERHSVIHAAAQPIRPARSSVLKESQAAQNPNITQTLQQVVQLLQFLPQPAAAIAAAAVRAAPATSAAASSHSGAACAASAVDPVRPSPDSAAAARRAVSAALRPDRWHHWIRNLDALGHRATGHRRSTESCDVSVDCASSQSNQSKEMESHMNEPLIGSVSSPWPAAPFPPTGWLPSSMSVAGRPLAGAPPACWHLRWERAGYRRCRQPAPGISPGSVTPAIGAMPVGATIPSFAGSEVAVGVPVSALLAAVAVRRGQPLGPTNDQEIEDFIYDALELLPGSGEVDVRCESGRVTFDRHRSLQAAQTRCGRDCLGDSRRQRRPQHHRDYGAAALAWGDAG